MNDFWDEFTNSGDFVKFENVGDTVAGTITAIRRHMFEDGKVAPQIEIDTDDGAKTLTAGQVRLKALFAEKRPGVGDYITVTLAGIEKRPGGKTLKEFTLVVGPVTVTEQIPAGAFAQTAAAAPLDVASLTPEQKAALKGLL